MKVTQALLDTLCAIAEEAGAVILDVYESDFDAFEKADQSPLTAADMRADTVIRTRLEEEFSGVYILSEESRSASQSTTPDSIFFLVDPLDGTKEFIKRNGEFTVNIALIVDGAPVAGVVYAPALATIYYAGEGLGAWRRNSEGHCQLKMEPWQPEMVLQVIGSRSHGAEELNAWLTRLPGPYEFVAAGSSLKFCRVAEGRAHVYPRFGLTSQWDTAAAHCIVHVAGGNVVALDGATLRYGISRPILNSYFMACHNLNVNYFLQQSS